MPRIAYKDHRFSAKTRVTLKQAMDIIDEIGAAGYTLTLRQLYYQMVSRNFIGNTNREYKRLGEIITNARESGLIDWMAIEDRGRQAYFHPNRPTAADALRGIQQRLQVDPWLNQDVYLEVWVEKAALEGVIERPASRWRAPYMACKGYLSASEAWRAGQRFEQAVERGKKPVILHLGDHDPSGLHMTLDNQQRSSLFSFGQVEVQRLALNMDQVEQYNPPPNPAKMKDTRAKGYVAEHGSSSWELDALQPAVIDQLVHSAIESVVDQDKWLEDMKLEAEKRIPLKRIVSRWDEVEKVLMSEEQDPMARLAELDDLVPDLTQAAQDASAKLWPTTGGNTIAERLTRENTAVQQAMRAELSAYEADEEPTLPKMPWEQGKKAEAEAEKEGELPPPDGYEPE